MNFSPRFARTILAIGVLAFGLVSCDVANDENKGEIEAPDTYEFTRDGQSTVSYSGQTDRLNMLGEMDAYMGRGDDGEVLSEQILLDMYANKNGDGGGNFPFTSEKQLKNKTFTPDLDDNLFENIFAAAADASVNGSNGVTAENGVAGLITRESSGKTILVSAKGREFGQLVEKGLMGAVFFNQIYNSYLTDEKIGPTVENEALEEGKNYTAKEHHFDEAFGYFGAPVDFSSDWPEAREDDARYWAHYSDGVDAEFGMNDLLMEAYIKGRTAIVNKDQIALNAQVDILYENLELLAAATTVHYINSTISHLNNGEQGEAFHTLSEAWAFANALKYSPRRKITLDELNTIMESNFGESGNFWMVTITGLNTAKSTLVEIYSELESVKDQL